MTLTFGSVDLKIAAIDGLKAVENISVLPQRESGLKPWREIR